MKFFNRYRHVEDLMAHYAKVLDRADISRMLQSGVATASEAESFSAFVWQMAGRMNQDAAAGIAVLGASDNTEMIPDVYFEIGEFMAQCGFEAVWLRVCAEA